MGRKSENPNSSKPGSLSGKKIVIVAAAVFVGLAVTAAAAFGTGWISTRGQTPTPETTRVTLAPESLLSDKVKTAPPVVREAYRFAIANPDTLSQFPCYCGCGAMGHGSNLDCFVDQFNEDGSVVLDNHAFG